MFVYHIKTVNIGNDSLNVSLRRPLSTCVNLSSYEFTQKRHTQKCADDRFFHNILA